MSFNENNSSIKKMFTKFSTESADFLTLQGISFSFKIPDPFETVATFDVFRKLVDFINQHFIVGELMEFQGATVIEKLFKYGRKTGANA